MAQPRRSKPNKLKLMLTRGGIMPKPKVRQKKKKKK